MNSAEHSPAPMPLLDREAINTIVEEVIHRYFDKRRSRVSGFIDRHFSFKGALYALSTRDAP